MKSAPKAIAVALFFVTSQFAGVAFAQVPEQTPKTTAKLTAYSAQIQTKAPEDWIVFDDLTYTPVVDTVSRHLNAARKAFDAKDTKKAAVEMRAVAAELKRQAVRINKESKAQIKIEKEGVSADKKYAQEAIKRLNETTVKINAAADAIENGTIQTSAELDKTIDTAARADMDHRWLISDVTVWFPVSEEPQRHFTDAVAAYANKDYQAASAEIRKATSYLRLEAGRSVGASKQELNNSVVELGSLANSVEKGAMQEEHAMTEAFAKANHALAVAHQTKALKAWARKNYVKAGYELKAAAHNLESAAGWVGEKVKEGMVVTVEETRAIGTKLHSGYTWTHDEVAKKLEALEHSLKELGQKINPSHAKNN